MDVNTILPVLEEDCRLEWLSWLAGDQLIGINTADETESETFFPITLTIGHAAVKETPWSL